jgi:L-proline amide hydrolase
VAGPYGGVTTQGLAALSDHHTWFRRSRPNTHGEQKTPVLLLHGGPGLNSDYLGPLCDVLARERPVIRYDQLACGRSESPLNRKVDGFAPFLDELSELRMALGLERVHLLGHSWGGMLALEYALTAPTGVESLVLASAPFSAPLWSSEMERLRSDLPALSQAALLRCEAHQSRLTTKAGDPPESGTTESVGPGETARQPVTERMLRRRAPVARAGFRVGGHPLVQALASPMSRFRSTSGAAYQLAQMAFTQRHVCRMRRPPLDFFRSVVGLNADLYGTLWGPSEFHVTGTLRQWDVTDRLAEIALPTLITSGRHDEATPAQMQRLHEGIADSRWIIFEESAHLAHLEEPAAFAAAVGSFLAEVDSGDSRGSSDSS